MGFGKETDYGSWSRPTPPGIIARQTTNLIPPLAPPPAAAQLVRVVQVPAPDVVPPAGSVSVNTLVQANTVGAGDVQALATFQVPDNSVLIVPGVTFYIDDMVQATNILFSCFENGAPVPGYNNVQIFPGVVARASQGFDVTIRIHEAALFTVTATNVDGGAHLIGAAFQGWHMPRILYDQYGGQPF